MRRLTPVVCGSEQPRHAVSETQACGDRQRQRGSPKVPAKRALAVLKTGWNEGPVEHLVTFRSMADLSSKQPNDPMSSWPAAGPSS